MFDNIFSRGWYKIADRHSCSPAMLALQNEGNDMNFYGLYMFLYDTTIQTNGEIKRRDLELYCRSKAKLSDEEMCSFITCCIDYEVLVANEDDENLFYLPEVQAYLKDAEEQRRKRLEASSKGGLKSAEVRAKANTIETEVLSTQCNSNNQTDFHNARNYVPYVAGYNSR